MNKQILEYCIDESKYTGWAESISFPENEEELKCILEKLRTDAAHKDFLERMAEHCPPVTIQGGKTGITGAAVPEGGHIINLSKMNHFLDFSICADGTAVCRVEPGINLIDLQRELNICSKKVPVFWPAEPTERTAMVGGIAATGANGICSYWYGDNKDYIKQLKLLCWDGRELLITEKDGIWADIIGAEGATGIITEITLKLLPKPESIWGITFFFEEKESVCGFVEALKRGQLYTADAAVAAVEYMNDSTIRLIESYKKSMMKIREVPDIDMKYRHLIYIEIHGTEDGIEELTELLMGLAMEQGCDLDAAWAVSGEREIERMHDFRHAAAEASNLKIEAARRGCADITKLGCDMSFPNSGFEYILTKYEQDLKDADLKSTVFGHVKDIHLHVNILPETKEEYVRGMELMRKWAQDCLSEKGVLAKEHGIGKLKKKIYGEEILRSYLAGQARVEQQNGR